MRTSLPSCGHTSCTAEALGGSMRICSLLPLSPTRLSGLRTSIWPNWPANSGSHTGLAAPDERPWPSSDGTLFVSFRYRHITSRGHDNTSLKRGPKARLAAQGTSSLRRSIQIHLHSCPSVPPVHRRPHKISPVPPMTYSPLPVRPKFRLLQ